MLSSKQKLNVHGTLTVSFNAKLQFKHLVNSQHKAKLPLSANIISSRNYDVTKGALSTKASTYVELIASRFLKN